MLLMPEVSKTFHASTVSENSVPFHESPLVGPYSEPHKSGHVRIIHAQELF